MVNPRLICKSVSVLICMILSCSPDVNKIISGKPGSNLSVDGEIEDHSLEFIFPIAKNKRTNKDLFHYIYFKGDTVCFSFLTNYHVKAGSVRVWFVEPKSGKRFAAERVDVEKDRIHGFSLLGTLMAQFHKESVEKNIPPGAFCCSPISFKVILTINQNGQTITSSLTDSFEIQYK